MVTTATVLERRSSARRWGAVCCVAPNPRGPRRLSRSMTFRTFAASLAALALASGPASAVPVEIRDARGDWPVPSQDIVAVRLERTALDGRPAVRAVLTLAAAPDPASAYHVRFGLKCATWSLGNLDPAVSGAFLVRESCGSGELVSSGRYAPATAEVRGNDVVLTAPMAVALRPGQRLEFLAAEAASGGSVRVLPPNGYTNGDNARGEIRFVL